MEMKTLHLQLEGQSMEIAALKNAARLKGEEAVAQEAKHQREKELMFNESGDQVRV